MGEYIVIFVLVYLDDILVFSTIEHDHEYYLRLVFKKLREHKLQAKLKKCDFRKPCVKYLGHVVGLGEVHVDQNKVAALANWEAPTDIKESSAFWVLLTITTDSSLISQR